MKEIEYIATCPEETKDLVVQELKTLDAKNITPGHKSVSFYATNEIVFKICLKIRTASRILRVLRKASCTTPQMLRNQSSRIHWTTLLPNNSTFIVKGVAGDRGPGAMSSNDISKMIRGGLEESFRKRNLTSPKVDLKNPKVVIVGYVHDRKVTISIDISGKSFHKRGYREDGHPAPLKETLASSILLMAGYDGSQILLDPMCGSGTIAIEGSYIALQKASLIHRKKGDFGFEWLADFDRPLWRQTQELVRQQRAATPAKAIFASDISKDYVNMARSNALRARVEKHIHFNTQSFLEMTAPAESGLLVANLPYGERLQLDHENDLKVFYKSIGDTLKQNFCGWKAALLASEDSPYKFIGLKPTRKIPILNGSIKCKLLIFEIYKGKKGQHS